jgi:hypothetical protein
VTVDVTGGGGPLEEFPPPPHALSEHSAAALTAISNTISRHRRFLKPKQQSTTARAETGNSGLEPL